MNILQRASLLLLKKKQLRKEIYANVYKFISFKLMTNDDALKRLVFIQKISFAT